uniref:FANCI solenoid 2 domain-containing protein n=1 Tax=Rhodosorus marinus TaxID=101924 RepID=A0A7S2ZHX0_9RHOD|mmetsp:Transcript_20125/g.80921  ORF Transcript_20125/g.80921 Transcript_20125/m.80921 type:complete len:979 (+) Transcript_20125:299-3235(+)
MSSADRLVQIYENGGNGRAIEDFVNGLRKQERKTLLTELKIRVGACHASLISLFRAEVACSILRPFAIATVAVSTANSTLSTASVESYVREAQIGLLEIPYDTSLSRQEKVDELNSIANDILDQIERERISRWHFGAIDIALAAVRCATDQGLQNDGQISSDAIVERVLDWPWTTATSAGLLDALGTVSLSQTSQLKLFKKLRAILNEKTSAEEEFFILGKQIIGMWVSFKGLRIKEWADLVRYAIHAPPDSVCGDLLCMVEIEVSGAASAGTSILECYESLPHRFDGGLSGRDLALILTVSRADDAFLEDAMKIATSMFLVPDDLILHPRGEGSSSSSNDGIASRRRLLNDALKLPGMERSANTVLELAESWIAHRRALLPELGVEAFVTVFALQPHARDEVLSEALSTLSESSTSRKVAMSMISILEQLSWTLRGTMRDHLSRVQAWIDYVADLPLDYARRVLAALAPFASLSPAFGDKLLIKLQKLAASRDHSKKCVAVYGLAELVPHLSPGSEGLVESAIDALRVALRRGTVDVRGHVYLGTLGVADSILLGPESSALKALRQELMRRFATVTDASGRLVVGKILVNICGHTSVREPIPELLVCVSRICGAASLQPMVEQWLRPSEEAFAQFPDNEPDCSLWSNVVLGACAALIESGALTSDSQALDLLDTMIQVKTRPRRHRKRRKSLSASIDRGADSAENSGISHSESNTVASRRDPPEPVGDLLDVEPRASPLSLKTALGLGERVDNGTRVETVFPLMEIIVEHLNTHGNKIGWETTERLLKTCVKWLVITKSDLGIVDPIPIHESIVTTPVSMFKKLFFGELNSPVAKRERFQAPHSNSVRSSAPEERHDATIPLREKLVLILRFVTEKFGVTTGRTEPVVSSAVKPLIGETAIIGRYQTPEFETTADGVLLALCCQFEADFTRSMTVQLSTIYLSSMQSLLKHASDSALVCSWVMCTAEPLSSLARRVF